jgi:hypothetical protein
MVEKYVPRVQSLLLAVPTVVEHVIPGSAVVAEPYGDGMLSCYYEGGRHDPKMGWDEKITHAAGRLAERYPTAARMTGTEGVNVKVVGTVRWDPKLSAWLVDEITDEASLREWRGEDTRIGASDEQRSHAAGRILSTGGASVMTAFAIAKAEGRDAVQAVLDHAG